MVITAMAHLEPEHVQDLPRSLVVRFRPKVAFVRIESLRGQGRVCARFVDCLVCRQLCVILKEQSDFTDEICPTLSTISRLSKTQVRRCSTIGHLMIHEGLVD